MDKKSTLFIIIAAALWGGIGIFVNGLSDLTFDRPQMVFVRILTALIGMLLFMLIFDRKGLKIRLRDIWCFIGTGLFSLYFFNVCYFYSMQYNNSLGVAAVLLYTAPAFVTVLSCFLFKEKFTLKKTLSLVLMTAGCVLVSGIVTAGAEFSLLGILFGLGSGFGYALYSIFGRYALNRGYRSSTISFYTFAFALIGAAVTGEPIKTSKMMFTSFESMFLSLGLGIVCCVLPYIFYTKGLERTESSVASILATAEPMVASIIGIAFFDDAFSLPVILGIAVMIAGIIIMNINRKEKNNEKNSAS